MFVIGVLLTMTDIFLRSVSTLTVEGMVDIMQLCVLTGAMLAIPHAFLSDQHVAIDIFVEKMPGRLHLALRIVAAFLAIAFLTGVLWFSYEQALNEAHDRSQTIGIPMSWYWAPFLVGIALSVFANIVLAVQLWRHGLPVKAPE
ncbi:MAG: TRAP transporter small permease [Proteobacteria bacterium]|nr:TRAP transporter small permease [Pseudomonadota bacterium]